MDFEPGKWNLQLQAPTYSTTVSYNYTCSSTS
jgi:hypothetical protein